MTYRERREAKAEKLREWAEKREAKSKASFDSATRIADGIPFGQPILVGHHSEKRHRRDLDRIDSGMRKGFEHARKAEDMVSRAGNIEAQLDASIYDDDPDALERLEERVAALEAERDVIKRFNLSCRRGQPDYSLLTERQRADLLSTARVAAYSLGKGGGFPAYVLSNLSGNIKRNRDRIASLRARRARAEQAEANGGILIRRVADFDACTVTFAEKPDRSLLNELKAAGFYWSKGSWSGKFSKLPAELTKEE